MGRKRQAVRVIQLKGRKHLTKEEIEKRLAAEASLQPNTDAIAPPAWLDADGRREWDRVVKELSDLQLMTNLDVTALAVYCDAVSGYIKATKKMHQRRGATVKYTNKAGATNEIVSPHLMALSKYSQIIRAFCAEFGLTPSARLKLTPPRTGDDRDELEREFGV